MKYLFPIMLLIMLVSCKNEGNHQHSHEGHGHQHKEKNHHAHGEANKHMHKSSFEDLVKNFESPERASYQKPDEVLDYIGPLSGKTVMDIGSGTGYFSFRMVERGARVICTDVDERFLTYIDQKIKEKGISDDMIETRKVPYDSPGLSDKEVDMVLTVNTYHHFEDRPTYFSKVKEGIKPNGQLVIIDFKKEETPMGPQVEMRLQSGEIVRELREAGFESISVNSDLLPYQNIVIAK